MIPDSEGDEGVCQAFWGCLRCRGRRVLRDAGLSPDGQRQEEEQCGDRWAESGTSVASDSALPFSTSPRPSLQRRGIFGDAVPPNKRGESTVPVHASRGSVDSANALGMTLRVRLPSARNDDSYLCSWVRSAEDGVIARRAKPYSRSSQKARKAWRNSAGFTMGTGRNART